METKIYILWCKLWVNVLIKKIVCWRKRHFFYNKITEFRDTLHCFTFRYGISRWYGDIWRIQWSSKNYSMYTKSFFELITIKEEYAKRKQNFTLGSFFFQFQFFLCNAGKTHFVDALKRKDSLERQFLDISFSHCVPIRFVAFYIS